MAQHLLAAADLYQLTRLRRICERRLCESVDVETAATTLALAEQNHAEELKRVCLDFVSRHLGAVMATEGYRHMTRSCPSLQAELLAVIASAGGPTGGAGAAAAAAAAGAAGGGAAGPAGGGGGAAAAAAAAAAHAHHERAHRAHMHVHVRRLEDAQDERRVRQRRGE
jgi:speckle-type POZ protein